MRHLPESEAALQRAGLLMDFQDAMFHVERGERVVRLAWGSLKPGRWITDEDEAAQDWVVLCRD